MAYKPRDVIYKNIYDSAFKEDSFLNDYHINCIHNTDLIYIHENKIYIRNLITDIITIKHINFEFHFINRIYTSDDFSYIFLVYTKNIDDREFKWISKINISNDEIVHVKFESINDICIYNNYIIISDTTNYKLTVIDFDFNIITEYYNIFAVNIKKTNNYIIVSNMISFNPSTFNVLIMKLDIQKRQLIKEKEFINTSCGSFSKDEKLFYVYDNNKEELYLYETFNWIKINTISMKINKNTFWYKNKYFSKIYLFPNKYVMLSNHRTSELWDIENSKYIGTFSKTLTNYTISDDNNYIIGIDDSKYYLWKLDYGKFDYYKKLVNKNKLNLSDELWNMIETHIVMP